MTKVGPLENVVNEKIVGYTMYNVDAKRGLNGGLVLYFESGKKLFIAPMVLKEPAGSAGLFLSPENERNGETIF